MEEINTDTSVSCLYCPVFIFLLCIDYYENIINPLKRDGTPLTEQDSECRACLMDVKSILKYLEDAQLMTKSKTSKPKWKKLLYIKQPFADNHVDESFLEEMQNNANVRYYDYWEVVGESCVITQHFSSIIMFIAIFMHLYERSISIESLVFVSTIVTVFGYIYWQTVLCNALSLSRYSRTKTLKGTVLFVTTLLGLSPILKTLTQDTSDDTIWALTFCFFFINLLCHDYGSSNIDNIKYPGSLSTNAAIFASVLLASRLSSNMEVFGLILFAIQNFALFPIFRRGIKAMSTTLTKLLTIILASLPALSLMISFPKSLLIFYFLCIMFITFVCPFWLIRIQRYKNEIRGPWDEAKLVLSTTNNYK